MIKGHVVLEDISISFNTNEKEDDGLVKVTIIDLPTGESDTARVPQSKFFKALAIAVHQDGIPDWADDYPDAESIMPENPLLRWIP